MDHDMAEARDALAAANQGLSGRSDGPPKKTLSARNLQSAACASFATAPPMPAPAWPRPGAPVRGALAQILNQVIEGLDGGDPDLTGLGPSSMPR
jgi:hypothetical protein